MPFRAKVQFAGPRTGRKEHLFRGTPSIQAQNYIRANRRSVRKRACWRVNTRNYILLLFASAAGASEEILSDFFTILENAMKSATKEMFSTFLLKQSMTGNGAFRKKSS